MGLKKFLKKVTNPEVVKGWVSTGGQLMQTAGSIGKTLFAAGQANAPANDPNQVAAAGQILAMTGGGGLPMGGKGAGSSSIPMDSLIKTISPAGGAGGPPNGFTGTPAPEQYSPRTRSPQTQSTLPIKESITLPGFEVTAKPPTVWQRIQGWVETGYNWAYVAAGAVVFILLVWWAFKGFKNPFGGGSPGGSSNSFVKKP